MTPKHIATAAAIAALAAGAYLGLAPFLGLTGADLSKYADTNINLGAATAPAYISECDQTADTARLICLIDLLKADVPPQILVQLQRPYSLAEAQQWSNFPPMGFPGRVGPTLGDFTPEQHGLIREILMQAASLTGNEGYDELEQVLNADDYLLAETAEAGFSSSNYHLAFLGTPAASGTWQLYFGGHHFALTNTYRDGVLIGATPSFRGVEPFTPFAQNGRDNAPMLQEQAAFAAMFAALSADELARATLADSYTNIIAGPQQDSAVPTAAEGLSVAGLTPAQQSLVLAAMETYVRDINTTDADAIMARYTAELPDTFIALSGTPTVNAENDYVRIHGHSVWIEFSLQPGRSIEGIHPHSVWRDRVTDYGGSTE